MPVAYHHTSLGRLFSLRSKLIILMSLVVVFACSSLSWYFITQHITSQTQSLLHIGTLLSQNLAFDGRYSLYTKDRVGLRQLIAGALPAKEVVYIRFTDSTGHTLAASSKGMLAHRDTLTRSEARPLFPDQFIAHQAIHSRATEPHITSFRVTGEGRELIPPNHGKTETVFTTFFAKQAETIYDFAVPILRDRQHTTLDPSLAFELQQGSESLNSGPDSPTLVYGLVQIGLSDVYLQKNLHAMIWQVVLIALCIMAIGIALTVLLASRFTTPLKALTGMATRVSKGELSALLPKKTDDEIGDLTAAFNHMTQSLRDRNWVVDNQIQRLKTLNHIGSAITSSVSLPTLLPTVLDLMVNQSVFRCAVLALYDETRRTLYNVQSRGVPDEVAQAIKGKEFPIQADGGLLDRVLLHGQALVGHDLTPLKNPFDIQLLAWAHHVGIGSFIIAPLQSDHRTLGLLAVDKGAVRCENEDLDFLQAITTKLGIAIDRAMAHQELEELTHTLESHVQERTEELQQANDKLKDLDRLKSTFVSIASHELRTPLTSIKVFVENMLQGVGGALSSEHLEYMTRIRANIERLRRMIAELLDVTQIESGRMKLSFGPVSLSELTEEAVAGLAPLSEEKGITVRVEGATDLPLVLADRDKLLQILTNLIHNAVNFTDLNGQVEIALRSREDERLEVCIADTGCGIKPEDLDKIFLPFYRASSTPSQAPGAGLGLALTRHLVELHRGQVWATSTPGKGSRFYLTLPSQASQKTTVA